MTTFAVRDQGQDGAVILIHGFGGESHTTFGMLPAFLAGSAALEDWDLHCFGYPTSLSPDVTGVWAADPPLTTLAGLLTTTLEELALRKYKKLVLVGHSMGGLIIQRALLDGKFRQRVQQVVLFGTPSRALKWWGKLFKRQAGDMDANGKFIARSLDLIRLLAVGWWPGCEMSSYRGNHQWIVKWTFTSFPLPSMVIWLLASTMG